MQLTQKTVKVLKNFSGLNQGILFRPGNVISTITKAKNLYARATVEETFDREFGIFDLRRFLAIYSMFDDADVDFFSNEYYCTISSSDGSRRVKFFYAEKSTFDHPPEKEPNFNDPLASFKLPQQVLTNAMRAAGILAVPDIRFAGVDGKIEVQCIDTSDPTKNTFSETIPDELVDKYEKIQATLKTDCLKMLPADYQVSVHERCTIMEGDSVFYLVAINSR